MQITACDLSIERASKAQGWPVVAGARAEQGLFLMLARLFCGNLREKRKLVQSRYRCKLSFTGGAFNIATSSAHFNKVVQAVESGAAAAQSRLAASWCRSVNKHGLNPGRQQIPDYLAAQEVALRRQALGGVVAMAKPRLDQLFALVGRSGCGVVLTDTQAVIIDHRFQDADAPVFQGWGLGTGADWSEAAQGTNGIGTCLVGDAYAAVIAETLEQAMDAVEMIDADIDELDAVVDMTDALANSDTLVHDEIGTNQCFDWGWIKDNRAATDQAIKNAPHVATLELVNNRLVKRMALSSPSGPKPWQMSVPTCRISRRRRRLFCTVH